MSGAQSRRKGLRFEQALVHRFQAVMPGAEVKRGFQYRSGQEAADVELPYFFLEAKHHRRTNIRAALEQATAAAAQGEGRWPIAVCKDDNRPAIVAMGLEDFLSLVGQWWAMSRTSL